MTKTDISEWSKSDPSLFLIIRVHALYFINIDIILYNTNYDSPIELYIIRRTFYVLYYNLLIAKKTVLNINSVLALTTSCKNIKCLFLDESPCIYIILYPCARRFMKKKFSDNWNAHDQLQVNNKCIALLIHWSSSW